MTGPAVPGPTVPGPADPDRSVPAPVPPVSPEPAAVAARRSRAQLLADLRRWLRGPEPRVAVVILLVAVVLGVVQGAVWAGLAPRPPYKVYADGTFLGLPTVSSQLFIGIAIYALLGLVVGIVLAAGVWRIRRVRGTFTLLGLTGAAAVGAWLAYVVGNAMSTGIDPASIGATGAESLVAALPGHYALAIVAEPALAAAVYTFLAAWNGNPQLGRPQGRASADSLPAGPVPATEPGGYVAAPNALEPLEPLTAPVPVTRPDPPTGPLTVPGR